MSVATSRVSVAASIGSSGVSGKKFTSVSVVPIIMGMRIASAGAAGDHGCEGRLVSSTVGPIVS